MVQEDPQGRENVPRPEEEGGGGKVSEEELQSLADRYAKLLREKEGADGPEKTEEEKKEIDETFREVGWRINELPDEQRKKVMAWSRGEELEEEERESEISEERIEELRGFGEQLARLREQREGSGKTPSGLPELAQQINQLPQEEIKRILAFADESFRQRQELKVSKINQPRVVQHMAGGNQESVDSGIEEEGAPTLEEKFEAQRRIDTERQIEEIYQREAAQSEKFKIDHDTINEVSREFDTQMADITAGIEREILQEKVAQSPQRFPELQGADLDELPRERVRQYINKRELADKSNQDPDWKDLQDLKKSLEEFDGTVAPGVQLAILGRLPHGETREKIWGFLTGENLEEKAAAEMQPGQTREEYAEQGYIRKGEELRYKREKELGLMSEENWWRELEQHPQLQEELPRSRGELESEYQERFRAHYQSKFDAEYVKFDQANALRELGYDLKELTTTKRKWFREKEVPTGKVEVIDAQREAIETFTVPSKDILLTSPAMETFLRNHLNGKISNEIAGQEATLKEELGQEWDQAYSEKVNEQKREIIERTLENAEEAIDDSYTGLQQELMARYLARARIEQTPEGKQEIEAKFGEGVLGDMTGMGKEIMLEEGGRLKGDLKDKEEREVLQDILESSGLFGNPEFERYFKGRLRNNEFIENYQKATRKKHGILEILFEEILNFVPETLEAKPSTARPRRIHR